MDKGNTKKGKKHRNKEAIEFVLANRDADDPNYNDPNANKKVLLQVNKDEDLTEEQKKLVNSIPKIQRGIFDEEAKLKRLLNQENDSHNNSNNNNNDGNTKKGVHFNFDKNEVINYDKKQKISEIQKDQLLNDLKNNKIDLTKIDDEEKVNEIFKKLKIKAKMVEYNELGVKKDTDPELLKFITNKEFVEGVDIFVPAPRDNNGQIIKEYDNDMKEENMNEEFKELEKELKSDSENENKEEKNKKDKNSNPSEEIDTTSKKDTNNENENDENLDKNKKIEITGDLEDDFVLLANGGELPFEIMTEKEIKEEEKKNEMMKNKNESMQQDGKPSFKYITPEEVEYVRKKFLEVDDDDDNKKKSQKKGNFISKKEFNDAINEILNAKKGKTDNKIETVMGLKKSVLDEDEYEEYELSEEEEEEIDEKEEKVDEKKQTNINNKKIDNKQLKNIINFKKEDKKEEYDDEDEEEEEDDEDFKPNIKIEYVSKADEPDPFDKDKNKKTKKQKNKKEMKKSKTKQYEQLKAMGELSDDSFDKDQFDEMIHEENVIEKTKEMIENHVEVEKDDKEINQEIENKFIFEPKVKKDITQIDDKVGNLPKSVKGEKKEKDFQKNKKNEKDENEEDKKEEDNKKNSNINENNININHSRRDETKEEKKLRQKLVKMERKEKRAEKKKLKNAFKEEKVSQQKQIAQANKIVRYGLSVKDI